MPREKLVRDKIPQIILEDNGTPDTRYVSSLEEYEQMLWKKLWEEVDEFLEAEDMEQRTREAADVLEVLFAFLKLKHIVKEELMEKIRTSPDRLVVGISELRMQLLDQTDALEKAADKGAFSDASVRLIRCIRAIMQRYEVELAAILAVRQTLYETRGGFEKGIILTIEDE